MFSKGKDKQISPYNIFFIFYHKINYITTVKCKKTRLFFLTIQPSHNRIVTGFRGLMNMSKKGTLLILAAAIVWGLAGVFVKKLEEYSVPPAQMALYRCLFTAVVIGIFILIKDRKLFSVKPRDIWLFAANGVFSIVMFSFCYYKTMELSTLSVAAVLLYTAPIFVMIMSVFIFKEKLTVKKVLALLVAVAGCVMVSGLLDDDVNISAAAIIYGLLTGFGYALYTVFSNLLLKRGYSAFTIIFYTFVFAAVGAGAVLGVTAAGGSTSPDFSAGGLFWGFLLALCNSVLPYILYTYGLKYTEPSKAPVIATVEPVTATVLGLFYGEKLTVFGAAGRIAVLSSVLILSIGKGEKHEN